MSETPMELILKLSKLVNNTNDNLIALAKNQEELANKMLILLENIQIMQKWQQLMAKNGEWKNTDEMAAFAQAQLLSQIKSDKK